MGNFDLAYRPTAIAEGGYVNNKNDSGGMTAFGITRRDWPKWIGWPIIDKLIATHGLKNAIPIINSNQQLKLSAKGIFKISYWDVCDCDLINNQAIAWQCFDSAINMGADTAAKLLQRTAGVTIDFHVGPKTIAAVNSADAKLFYSKFVANRKAYYDAIIAKNPKNKEFKASWYSRANMAYDKALGANNFKLMAA